MHSLDAPHAILITGPYGSGKSSLAGEIAEIVEGDLPYAAIDLDWLAWFDAADGAEGHETSAVELRNLSDVVRNYLEVGIRLFVIAGAVRHAWEMDAYRDVSRCASRSCASRCRSTRSHGGSGPTIRPAARLTCAGRANGSRQGRGSGSRTW